MTNPGSVAANSDAKSETTQAEDSGVPGGNPSYGGYEYQISVTVWAGLDLLLFRDMTDTLVVEPRSHEDVQAVLKVKPTLAEAHVTGEGKEYELLLQTKSRSTGPWSARAIAKILAPRVAKSRSRGRAPRESPLEMLARNTRLRYMFVTNEGLQSSLYPHRAESFIDWPDARTLPPRTSSHVDVSQRASIAGRLAFCPGVTFEVLDARIRSALALHGHVPIADHDACIRELKNEVRERLLGTAGGRWRKDELIATLLRHHGSLLPTRDLDHYIRPTSFETIRRALFENHAVVIAGPSGTGKTLTANVLEHMLRQSPTPFSVIGEEHGPGHVQAQLARPDPILFHLRDPWGGNELAFGHGRWTNELPKLLGYRNANRKFLVTSRSDVLHSAGKYLEQELRPHVVALEVEHYGHERIEAIYERRSNAISGRLRGAAQAYRYWVLEVLQRPFEVDRFFVGLARDNPSALHDVEKLIAESQIEAISRVVCQQVLGRAGGMECAAFLWGLLAARTSIAETMVPKLRRQVHQIDPHVRLEAEGFVDFLIAGRNLRRDGASLSFYHPRVEDGLRAAIESQAATGEVVLSRLGDALAAFHDQWGIETVLRLCRAAKELKAVQLEFSPATQQRLDALLLSNVLRGDRLSAESAFGDLADYGSSDSAPARVARALLTVPREPGKFHFGTTWRRPEVNEAEWESLLSDDNTSVLAQRFVADLLPFTRIFYSEDVLPFVSRLSPDLRAIYWGALRAVVANIDGGNNILTLVSGACSADAADLDAAVELFVQAAQERERELQADVDQLCRANELEVDEWEGDLAADRLGSQSNPAEEGLEAVISIRDRTEGFGWILEHVHRSSLLASLAAVLHRCGAKPADLRILIQGAKGWQRGSAWALAADYWHPSLEDLYTAEMLQADTKDAAVRQALIRIARLHVSDSDPDPWIRRLAYLTCAATAVRRLELIQDVASTRFEDTDAAPISQNLGGLSSARKLADTYEGPLRELAFALIGVLEQRRIEEIVSILSENSKELLATLLPETADSLAALLISLVVAVGTDPVPTVQRLLESDVSDHGVAAVQALAMMKDSTVKSPLFDTALRHRRYAVRRETLTYLASRAEPADRAAVLAFANDPSAGVRLALAERMGEHRWPEAIATLVHLLRDTRDFSKEMFSMPRSFESEYEVTRAAAAALGCYEKLPESAITALIESMEDSECADVMVGCTALYSLLKSPGERDDPRTVPLLLSALERPGPEDSPFLRPLSVMAADELLDRVRDGGLTVEATDSQRLVKVACMDSPDIATPVLLTLHALDSDAAVRLTAELRRIGKPARAELLLVAAAMNGRAYEEQDHPALKLLAQLSGAHAKPLTDTEHKTLHHWRSTLDSTGDVGSRTARLVAEFLIERGVGQPGGR